VPQVYLLFELCVKFPDVKILTTKKKKNPKNEHRQKLHWGMDVFGDGGV
jgi:hypothetical protein